MDNEYFKTIPEPNEPVLLDVPKKRPSVFLKLIGLAFFVSVVVIASVYFKFVSAPGDFPVETVIVVPKGETLSGSAAALFETRAIRSRFAFKVLMVLIGGTKGLHAGEYYLEKPQSSLTLAWRLSNGDYDLKNVRVTIPEGLNAKEIAQIFSNEEKFKYFNSDEFLKLSDKYEGYLFPDTYLFLPNATAEDVLKTMLDNYKKRIETLSSDVKKSGRSIEDIIKMASILEEEGRMENTRKVIAGILWKRLDENMPLQVDASIVYATGKSDGNKLVAEDFKLESPYNTYLHLGFPPTPISNPGLDAIRAAIDPIDTKYYFYLTDPQGGFHPAVTYDAHLINKAKYLP